MIMSNLECYMLGILSALIMYVIIQILYEGSDK